MVGVLSESGSDDQRAFQSFADFWPFYVREHAQAATRRAHFVGTSLALLILLAALLMGRWRWLVAVPVCGYALAWYSHFMIEKNRPATFKYPLWSLLGDLKMWRLMATGRMGPEIERILGQPDSTPAD